MMKWSNLCVSDGASRGAVGVDDDEAPVGQGVGWGPPALLGTESWGEASGNLSKSGSEVDETELERARAILH